MLDPEFKEAQATPEQTKNHHRRNKSLVQMKPEDLESLKLKMKEEDLVEDNSSDSDMVKMADSRGSNLEQKREIFEGELDPV